MFMLGFPLLLVPFAIYNIMLVEFLLVKQAATATARCELHRCAQRFCGNFALGPARPYG
jgi:hypothetical protein